MNELMFDLVVFAVPFIALLGLFAFRRFCDAEVNQNYMEGLAYKNGTAEWGSYAPLEQTRATPLPKDHAVRQIK